MFEAMVVVLAGGGMVVAGAQAVNLGVELAREKLNSTSDGLKRLYGEALDEPLPDDMQELLNKLGDNRK